MPTIYKPKKNKGDQGNYYDRERRKIYNSTRWRKLRVVKFSNSPLCEQCLKENKITPAEDIDHIVSFMSTNNPEIRYQLAYDIDNLMSLCKICHQRKHTEERKT